MSNLAISFASLVKNNNGMFKSQKQADFLLSQCDNHKQFDTTGQVHGSSYILTYHCDDKGVTKVTQHNFTSGKQQTKWERRGTGTMTIQDEKHIKSLQREIKKLQKKMESRLEGKEDYIKGCESKGINGEEYFQKNMDKDQELIDKYQRKIDELKGA